MLSSSYFILLLLIFFSVSIQRVYSIDVKLIDEKEESYHDDWNFFSISRASEDAERYFELMNALVTISSSASSPSVAFTSQDLRVLRDILRHQQQETDIKRHRRYLRQVRRVSHRICEEEGEVEGEGFVCLSLLLDSRAHGTQHFHIAYLPSHSTSSLSTALSNEEVLFDIKWKMTGPFPSSSTSSSSCLSSSHSSSFTSYCYFHSQNDHSPPLSSSQVPATSTSYPVVTNGR
jgi:hypothetical protein